MKYLIILILFLVPFVGTAQDCQQYKTGVFKCKPVNGEWVPDYKIIRKRRIQIEKTSKGFNKSKVVWIDDCTYQLIHIKSNLQNIKKGNITTVKIVKVTENRYEAIATSEAVNGSVTVVMKRID